MTLVFGHRGASGYRPEHTLASYELAIALGADAIEPDVVSTRDGVLVCRHENEISGTTDIGSRPELAHLRTSKVVDGVPVTGWFTEDLTLEQLRALRAVERLPGLRSTAYDGCYPVVTLDEALDLARSSGVGIAPEIKHSTYFRSIGLGLEEPLLAALRRHRLPASRVWVPSFEVRNLRDLRRAGIRAQLLQLVLPGGAPACGSGTYASMDLREVASYADWLGPAKSLVTPALVGEAHAAGLRVAPWTYRVENAFLPAPYQRGSHEAAPGDLMGELAGALAAGVDAVFVDQPDLGVRAVAAAERLAS